MFNYHKKDNPIICHYTAMCTHVLTLENENRIGF